MKGIIIILTLAMVECQGGGDFCRYPNIPRGKVKIQGREVRYKCKKGFTLVGPPRAKCLRGHLMPDQAPICVKSGCDPDHTLKDQVDHGRFKTLVPGAYMALVCDPGFRPKGGVESVFCDGKKWNIPHPPGCEKIPTDQTSQCSLRGWIQHEHPDDSSDWILFNSSEPIWNFRGRGSGDEAKGIISTPAFSQNDGFKCLMVKYQVQPGSSLNVKFLAENIQAVGGQDSLQVPESEDWNLITMMVPEGDLISYQVAFEATSQGGNVRINNFCMIRNEGICKITMKPVEDVPEGEEGTPSFLKDIGLNSTHMIVIGAGLGGLIFTAFVALIGRRLKSSRPPSVATSSDCGREAYMVMSDIEDMIDFTMATPDDSHHYDEPPEPLARGEDPPIIHPRSATEDLFKVTQI